MNELLELKFDLQQECPADLDWHGKAWGKTRCIVNSPRFQKHELKIEAGGFCSFHYHEERANRFIVKSGKVRIVWAYGWRLLHLDLGIGGVCEIGAGIPHQFQVIESGAMTEEYWSERGRVIETADIVRLTTGSKIDSELLFKRGAAIIDTAGDFWYGKQLNRGFL